MKTTVDIPDQELADLMRLTKAATKREAIVTAVTEFNRRQKMAAMVRYVGASKGEGMMSLDELMELRRRGTHVF